MIKDPERLRAILGVAAMSRVLTGMRRKLRLGRPLTGTVILRDPADDERRAIDSILGRRPSVGNPLVVRLEEIQARLIQAEVCDSLEEGVRAVTGPIANEPLARAAKARRWTELRESLEGRLEGLPQYRVVVEEMFTSGILKRLSEGDCDVAGALMSRLLAVLKALPQDFVPLANFATQVTGDSHMLDAGTPLSTLCLKAIAAGGGLELKHSASGRRRLWESVGVVTDELSHPVLTLNLRADTNGVLGRMLELAGQVGEPCHLTVRQLRQVDVNSFRGLMPRVYVCENPSVVAACAQKLRADCPALICTAGQPASAAQLLLSLLASAGCELMYHGDIDPSGIAITNMLVMRFGVKPWRMTSADYLARVDEHCPRFKGRSVKAIWDEELAGHLKLHGRAVLEEKVVDLLIEDLGSRKQG